MPGNYIKNAYPICDECHVRTTYLTTGVYHCQHCGLEFAQYKGRLNVYSITDDGERNLVRTTSYQTSVQKYVSASITPVILSSREIGRLTILKMVVDETLSTKKAARFMGISDRQVRNLRNRFLGQGETSLRDGHTRSGRRPLPSEIVALVSSNYSGCSIRCIQARLELEQGIHLGRGTVANILNRSVV